MRILLAHSHFDGYGGTETYMLTVAKELQQLGHETTIAAAESVGPVAQEARDAGIAVAHGASEMPAAVDAVLANDAATAIESAARYPGAARAMIVHSDFFPLQSPPQVAGVCEAIVVLNDRVGRHVESLAEHAPVVRLTQPIDLLRFAPREPAPTVARRALVLGNYVRGHVAQRIAAACERAGMTATIVGVHGEQTPYPERAIADHDLLIGLGRCVIEAMASRRAAYVFGIEGGDDWVTSETYSRLEADGFGGLAGNEPATFERLTTDLARWSPEMGDANRQLAVRHHNSADHARSLIELLRSLDAKPGPPAGYAEETARLIRNEWRAWDRFTRIRNENRELRERLAATERELEDLNGAFAELTGSRRHRIASALSAPLDALRRMRRR